MLDVHQLRVLTEVARTGSYTAAAVSLGYTQPAVSYQMRRLQQSVGAPLVVKAGRELRLTEIGAVLVRHADAVFSTLRAADQDVASVVARGGGLVRMAAFQSSCVTLVPELVARLRTTQRGVQVTVSQVEPADARRMVRAGEADLGLLCDWAGDDLPDGEGAMLRTELMTDRRCVLMREDDPLAVNSTVDLADLVSREWVMESFRDRFLAACTNLGFRPVIAATVDDVSAIQALVGSGLGISLMSELALHAHLAPGIVYRPLRNWPLRRTYALLWPDMATVPAVAAVLREVRSVAGELRDRFGAPEG
ncbi:LysR family transcriptional regulator [Streptomyces mirabilis]|uniref:LysR family transcriptional regulator n=1 Tax=Streptomyces mirabilis TaxID=68239 RepID=A0ABU3V599_9ACTN|nr:LysR family transcriptional regulator [Streptomyces mirabilis]MCX5355697.1 LysR family transcriptional regulator [Streptomyces mirabilis]MDU9001340.1 LysR family transcriptional regulator [Streptomyces mirabilis]